MSKIAGYKSSDDWEETDALIELCSLYSANAEAIHWIAELARRHHSQWQRVELEYSLSRARNQARSPLWPTQAEPLMTLTPDKQQLAATLPQTEVVTAAWHREAGRLNLAEEVLQQAVSRVDNDPDILSEIVLILAKKQWLQAAESTLIVLINCLTPETDQNAIARALGILAEVAVILSRKELFQVLIAKADLIEVEWLRAEALFWIAGWQAVSGAREQAQESYLKAVDSGFGDPEDRSQVVKAWTQNEIGWASKIARKAGWPSATAAAIFAGVALLSNHPTRAELEAILSLIDEMPVEYSGMRNKCHQLLARSLLTSPDHLVYCWQVALSQHRKRDRGEIWAAIGAYSASLATQFGDTFSASLWRELRRVQLLTSANGET